MKMCGVYKKKKKKKKQEEEPYFFEGVYDPYFFVHGIAILIVLRNARFF